MPEYGTWMRLPQSATEGEVDTALILMAEGLANQVHVQRHLIEAWDVEQQYGREQLKLNDGEQAIGVRVVIREQA